MTKNIHSHIQTKCLLKNDTQATKGMPCKLSICLKTYHTMDLFRSFYIEHIHFFFFFFVTWLQVPCCSYHHKIDRLIMCKLLASKRQSLCQMNSRQSLECHMIGCVPGCVQFHHEYHSDRQE